MLKNEDDTEEKPLQIGGGQIESNRNPDPAT